MAHDIVLSMLQIHPDNFNDFKTKVIFYHYFYKRAAITHFSAILRRIVPEYDSIVSTGWSFLAFELKN